ncbi:MAG: hypothetical protein ACFE8A_13375 [Candidatus Hodarchaeota archaeon]
MGKDFEVMISSKSKRYPDFMKVFGTSIVKVKSPTPHYANTPHHKKVLVYSLDLDLLTKEQREKLIHHISEKFNQPIDFVRDNLDREGMPILAEECSLIIKSPQRWS